MNTPGKWQGIPGIWLEQGKRWIATASGWTRIRFMCLDEAQKMCEGYKLVRLGILPNIRGCKGWLTTFQVHHRFGRGGGKRDDRRILPSGEQNLFALCEHCHSRAQIQRRPPVEPLPMGHKQQIEQEEPANTLD